MSTRRLLSPFILLFAVVASSAAPAAPSIRADTILIVKHERKLYLLHDNSPLRSYRIALGLSPTGAKEHEWDFRTPEGSYIIDFRRAHSHSLKALHISYPSSADLKRSPRSTSGLAAIFSSTGNRINRPNRFLITRRATGPTDALRCRMRICKMSGTSPRARRALRSFRKIDR